MYLKFSNISFITFLIFICTAAGCSRGTEEVDLINNESHKQQAYSQILNNPELQQELMSLMLKDEEAMKRMMRDSQFTGEFFKKENMNYIWDQNPGMDTTVIDNVTTRMHTDTNFMKAFDARREGGTPGGTR